MTLPHIDLVLERIRHRIATADPLVQAFAEWLDVHDLGSRPVGATSGLWTPRDVAIAGLREATRKATARPFAAGLGWLRSREFFRPHTPPVFEADPLAILAVAIGIRHCGDATEKTWIADFAMRAAVDETDTWRAAMLAGAVAAADAGLLRTPAELVVALATRGIGIADEATRAQAVEASILLDDAPGERFAVRLAALSRSNAFVSPVKLTPPGHAPRVVPMKVLLLAANPTTTDKILLDEEVRVIEDKIRLSEYRDTLHLVAKWAVRPDDLHLALLRHKPTIVHFSGHGAGHPGIVVHGDTPGKDYVINGDALRHLFDTLKRNIRVVVLNACESAEQAADVVEVVDFVIGMSGSMDDESARKFSGAFYMGIASGESVETAFQLGISAVKLHGLPDTHVPRLYVRPGASVNEVLCG